MKDIIKFKVFSFFKQLILYPIFLFFSLNSWFIWGTILKIISIDNPFGNYIFDNVINGSQYGVALGVVICWVLGLFFVRICFNRKGKTTSYQQYHPEYEKPQIDFEADVYNNNDKKIGTARYHQDGDSGVRKHLTGWGLLSYLLLPAFAITKAISLIVSFFAIFIFRLVVSVGDYLNDGRKHGLFFDILFYVFDISIVK